MDVAVIGGRGEAGREIVRALERAGQTAIVLGRGESDGEREHRRVDLATGEGLEAALAGTGAVVHAANAQRGAREVLVDGSERLIAAAAQAGVEHVVSLSIVGCDRVPIGYYRAKTDQDRVISASGSAGVGWSILPAAQFHALLLGAFRAGARFGLLPGGRTLLRPVATEIVGERIAEMATGPAVGFAPPLVGPEPARLGELARTYKANTGSRALVVPAPFAGRARRELVAGALAGDPGLEGAGPGFADWLGSRVER